jgi:hypothetical protein
MRPLFSHSQKWQYPKHPLKIKSYEDWGETYLRAAIRKKDEVIFEKCLQR